jgi:ferredoxin
MSALKVRIDQYDKEFSVAANQTILEAAYEAGVHLPYACQSGSCGSCIVLLKKGEVEMDHSGGIARSEIKEGYILTCCSIPKTDVVISLVLPQARHVL